MPKLLELNPYRIFKIICEWKDSYLPRTHQQYQVLVYCQIRTLLHGELNYHYPLKFFSLFRKLFRDYLLIN